MKKVLIVILVILVFVLGSYFMYKEVWPRLDKRITVTEEFNVKLDEDEKEEKIDLVSDAYSYNGKYQIQTTCAGEMEVTVDIKLPKINIDKPNALKLNETILNDFSDYTKYDENSGISGETKIEYKYSGWNNYLFIYIDGGITHRCSGGITANNIYYYDIENDKILNAEEIFNAAGLPQEE